MRDFKEYVFDKLIANEKLLLAVWEKTSAALRYNPYWEGKPLPIYFNKYAIERHESGQKITLHIENASITYFFSISSDGTFDVGSYKTDDYSNLVSYNDYIETVKAFFMYNFKKQVSGFAMTSRN